MITVKDDGLIFRSDTMFKKMIKSIYLGFIVFLFLSCEDKSTNPGNQSAVSFTSEYTKCLSHGLGKGSGLDSIFAYSFNDTLVLDFSVIANCCPDSNRFSVISLVGTDMILVSVADTMPSLCHCVCLYMTHAELINLPNDHYVVRCRLENSSGVGETIHLVHVNREVYGKI
jgi:hypothetical protein